MRIARLLLSVAFLLLLSNADAQNPLFIPDTLSGTTFNLNVQTGFTQFVGTNNTPTFGYNGSLLGPTLLIKKNDSITLNVTNSLVAPTTVHWHGFHVSPMNDGGPHQIILPGNTWSPSFKMRNEASTFWYHPHGEGKTEIQVSKGLAGMIIVRDSTEATYAIPRSYGIDDFPIIVQSKAFDLLYQIATATHEDTVMMVNGTRDPFLQVPQQVVRLRLLNGSSDRTYNFGLSDNSNFNLIGSDGGLLSQPYLTNRVRLSPGERAEILIDFASYTVGTQLYLKSYASELERGIIGADSVGTSSIVISLGYYSNPLNGADFNVLRLDVIAPTSSPITTIPLTFNPKVPLLESTSDFSRSLHFSADTVLSGPQGYVDGPFVINNSEFDIDSINIVTYLNNTEIWTLTNSTLVAHPFHIHDIEFFVLDINGLAPPAEYQGLKDVILVKPNDTVRFITKFTTFSDPMVPYMYHCHLLHHEDDGMMGAFVVIDPATIGINENAYEENGVKVFPNPTSNSVTVEFLNPTSFNLNKISVMNILGEEIYSSQISKNQLTVDMEKWENGIYIFQIQSNDKLVNKKIIKQ